MKDYWSLTEMYGKEKKNTDKKDKKKSKEKEKGKDKQKKKEFYESSKEKSESMPYGEFLKTKLTGIFEAKIKIGGEKKKVYIYRTEDMRYPNVFMDLKDQNFKDWVVDQFDNKHANPNRTMYSAEITRINIPKDLFNILKSTNIICKAYAAGMKQSPLDSVEDEELDEMIENADDAVQEITEN